MNISDEQEKLKQQILEGLPKPENLIDKTINYCLDNIRNGIEPEHYREVLKRLSKVKQR